LIGDDGLGPPALGFVGARVGEARGPGLLVDRHPDAVDLPAQGRMRSHVAHDLAR
jgi:hypothetical protein